MFLFGLSTSVDPEGANLGESGLWHSVLQTRLYSNLTHSKARGGEVLPKDDQPSGSRPICRAVVLVLAVVGLIVDGRSPGPNKEKKCR